MATFKDRDVFEYCEKLYEQFKKIDNGYYPHKHDDAVFQQVANHFAIKKKDAVDIYNSYSKLATKLEMMRINRLPEKKRKAALMRRMQDIIRTTLIISKKPGNTGISRDIRTEFTTDLLLSD